LARRSRRHLRSHRSAQRATENNQIFRLDTEPLLRKGKSGRTVKIAAFFGDSPCAAAVAAVIEDKYVDFDSVMQQFDVLDPVADVAGVTVEPNQGRSGCWVRDKPAIEANPIGCGEVMILEI
jgi:hypothetical protein